MDNILLRKLIRNILMEDAGFVPDYQKRDYYRHLANGLKVGKGEKVDFDNDTQDKGLDYFRQAKGGALNSLNSFKTLCYELKGEGLSQDEKITHKNSGKIVANTPISSMLSLMFNLAKNANKRNENILRDKITDRDSRNAFLSSFKNLSTKNNIKTDTIKCLLYYADFLEKTNNNLNGDVENLVNSLKNL